MYLGLARHLKRDPVFLKIAINLEGGNLLFHKKNFKVLGGDSCAHNLFSRFGWEGGVQTLRFSQFIKDVFHFFSTFFMLNWILLLGVLRLCHYF